jgi:hypothetical protein
VPRIFHAHRLRGQELRALPHIIGSPQESDMFDFRNVIAALASASTMLVIPACASGSGGGGGAPDFNTNKSDHDDLMAYMDHTQWAMEQIDIADEVSKALENIGEAPAMLPAGTLGNTLDGRTFDTTEAIVGTPSRTKAGASLTQALVRYIDGDTTIERTVALLDGEPFQCDVSRARTAGEFFDEDPEDANVAMFVRPQATGKWMLLKTGENIPPVATQQRLFQECLDVAKRAKPLLK